MVIIPGGHAGFDRKVGEVDFGKDSVLDLDGFRYRWYDHLMKGVDNGVDREKPVRVFVMGRNVWRDEDDWPLARALETRYYLHSGARPTRSGATARSPRARRRGARRLRTRTTQRTPSDARRAGPRGHGKLPAGAPGPAEGRGPQATCSSTRQPAFERDVEVMGPVSLELYVSSSAVDTDFTGKLVDVGPDGTAMNLTDGILRARYRSSMAKAELMTPGTVYRIRVDLWSTANVFLAGHRLRLEIASSNFPRFDRNPNTGGSPEGPGKGIVATNLIYHDRDHPSALILPVIP